MAKKKSILSPKQAIQLKGLLAEEKVSLIQRWMEQKAISADHGEFLISEITMRQEKKKHQAESNAPTAPRKTSYEEELQTEVQILSHLWATILNKRRSWVETRDPKTAELTPEERKLIKKFLTPGVYYDRYRELTSQLFTDCIKYPDKEINEVAWRFLTADKFVAYDDNLWRSVWRREFVPLDVIRFMVVKQEDGTYMKHEAFEDRPLVWELIPYFFEHRNREMERLEAAKNLADPDERRKQVNRKQKRLHAFETLISVYTQKTDIE